MHTGGNQPVSSNRLLATRAASIDGTPQFAVEGSVFVAGAAVQWLRDSLGLIPTAAESEAWPQACPIPAAFTWCPPSWDWGRRTGIRTRAAPSAA